MTPNEVKLLNETEVAEMIGRAVQTLRNDRHYGRGLPYIKFGRTVRYRLSDINAYLDANTVTHNN